MIIITGNEWGEAAEESGEIYKDVRRWCCDEEEWEMRNVPDGFNLRKRDNSPKNEHSVIIYSPSCFWNLYVFLSSFLFNEWATFQSVSHTKIWNIAGGIWTIFMTFTIILFLFLFLFLSLFLFVLIDWFIDWLIDCLFYGSESLVPIHFSLHEKEQHEHSTKRLLLCSTEESKSYGFKIKWGWINDDYFNKLYH